MRRGRLSKLHRPPQVLRLTRSHNKYQRRVRNFRGKDDRHAPGRQFRSAGKRRKHTQMRSRTHVHIRVRMQAHVHTHRQHLIVQTRITVSFNIVISVIPSQLHPIILLSIMICMNPFLNIMISINSFQLVPIILLTIMMVIIPSQCNLISLLINMIVNIMISVIVTLFTRGLQRRDVEQIQGSLTLYDVQPEVEPLVARGLTEGEVRGSPVLPVVLGPKVPSLYTPHLTPPLTYTISDMMRLRQKITGDESDNQNSFTVAPRCFPSSCVAGQTRNPRTHTQGFKRSITGRQRGQNKTTPGGTTQTKSKGNTQRGTRSTEATHCRKYNRSYKRKWLRRSHRKRNDP